MGKLRRDDMSHGQTFFVSSARKVSSEAASSHSFACVWMQSVRSSSSLP
eukprot:COSAG01_NODE_938_length_12628_cov_8.320137_12_plen_49_part_00